MLVPVRFLDTADDAFLADPHPVFDRLRAQDWLVPDAIGVSLISYDSCDAAFHDPALVPGIDWLLEDKGFGHLWGVDGHTLTDSEGVDHQRLRRAVSPWFTARRIDQLRTRTRELVSSLVGDETSSIEVMSGLADRVPSALFCWMVGADLADAEKLAEWSKALLLVFTAEPWMVEPVRTAKGELLEYTRWLLDAKRAEPADDLASILAVAEADGAISADDALYLLEELLSASVDNTANTTGLALHSLAAHPAQWRVLHDDPTLLANAAEECGRFEPGIRHTIKYATTDTELLGRPIEAGTYVTVRVAAAHRDPAVFADPHRLDVARKPAKAQLAFGAGRHYCLGAALGKMEVQEMVAGLTTRWPSARVVDSDMSITASGHVRSLQLEAVDA
ncbi:MAG: hypothetical protein JWM34_5030 [Ilumatobacteraceae bacterium]|nr:hypothetical protein [Ilumatobacteraceae bacterium]